MTRRNDSLCFNLPGIGFYGLTWIETRRNRIPLERWIFEHDIKNGDIERYEYSFLLVNIRPLIGDVLLS